VLAGARLPRVFAFFFTRSCHAARRAPAITSSLAVASRMWVAPILPHPPGTGRNKSGAPATNSACCSGDSIKFPYPCRWDARVAKILPPTRKSGAPIWEPSPAPWRLSAIRRKSAASMVQSRGFIMPSRCASNRNMCVTHALQRHHPCHFQLATDRRRSHWRPLGRFSHVVKCPRISVAVSCTPQSRPHRMRGRGERPPYIDMRYPIRHTHRRHRPARQREHRI
jgi:hypothetical protein